MPEDPKDQALLFPFPGMEKPGLGPVSAMLVHTLGSLNQELVMGSRRDEDSVTYVDH